MNYFQLYEAERKRFSKGSQWIRWTADIIEIIGVSKNTVIFKFIKGGFIGSGIWYWNKNLF